MPSPLTGKTLQLREVKLLSPAHTALHQQSRGWKTQTSACRAEWISSGSFVGLEGKPRTPLSSRVATRVSWSPLSGLKGVCTHEAP